MSFCREHSIDDVHLLRPLASDCINIFACFMIWLALGHTLLCKTVKAGTIMKYLFDAAKFVHLGRSKHPGGQTMPDPRMDPHTHQHWPIFNQIKAELTRWEKMPNRRSPATKSMYKFLRPKCNPATEFDSLHSTCDWLTIGLYLGLRLNEYGQHAEANSASGDIFRNVDGSARAFIKSDLRFFKSGRRPVSYAYAMAHPSEITEVAFRFRWQKNKNNGEWKSVVRNYDDPDFCPVQAVFSICQRFDALGLEEDHPLGVFTANGLSSGPVRYLTDAEITPHLRWAGTQVFELVEAEDIDRYSTHSIRVGACCTLYAAGCTVEQIQHALRWRSDAFKDYLRNLPFEASKTRDAVNSFDCMAMTIHPE